MNLMSAKCRQLGGLPIWGRRLRLKFGREGGNGAEGQTQEVPSRPILLYLALSRPVLTITAC